MIAVAPAPVLDCASLSRTAAIAITSGFANLQITIANLYEHELINLHHIFVRKVSIIIYYLSCSTNTN